MYFWGQMLGALIPTFLLSRLALWLLKKWDGGVNKLAVAHGGSLALCWVLSAIGKADGGPPVWSAGLFYILPQIVWFVFDVVRGKGEQVATDVVE